MDNKNVIEILQLQNSNIEKTCNSIGQLMGNLSLIVNNNKKLIAALMGTPYYDSQKNYNELDIMIQAGFISQPEAENENVNRLLKFIKKQIKEKLTRHEFEEVVRKVTEANQAGAVENKMPYLIASLKRRVEEKETEMQAKEKSYYTQG